MRGTILISLFVLGTQASSAENLYIARLLRGDTAIPPKKNFDLPDGIRNCVVRIRRETSFINRAAGGLVKKNYTGTGVIVFTKEQGDQTKFKILSADHVLRPKKKEGDEEFDTDYYFDFGDGDEGDHLPDSILFGTSISRVPAIDGKLTDMALITGSIETTKVPKLTIPEIRDVDGQSELIMAGCGNSVADYGKDRDGWYFNVTTNKTGVFRSGNCAIDKLVDNSTYSDADTGIEYDFAGIDSRMKFEEANGKLIFGSAFMTNGDSGGPAFQVVNGKWRLVGIHSSSVILDGKIRQNNVQSMVRILGKKQYGDWLKDNEIVLPNLGPS